MNTVKTWRQMDTLKCPIFFISSHTIISHTRDAACILYFRGRRRLPVSNKCGQAEEGLGGGLLHPHLLAPQIPQSTQFHLSHLQKSHLQVWFTEGCFHRVILKYPNPAQTGKIALSLTFYAWCPHLLSTLTTLDITNEYRYTTGSPSRPNCTWRVFAPRSRSGKWTRRCQQPRTNEFKYHEWGLDQCHDQMHAFEL